MVFPYGLAGSCRPDPRLRALLHRHGIAGWGVWLLLAAVMAVPLTSLRVDNSLDAWLPEFADTSGMGSFVIVGSDTSLQPAIAELGGLPVIGRDPDYTARVIPRPTGVPDAQFVDDVRASVRRLAGSSAGEVAIGGQAVFHAELDHWSQRRLPLIMALVLVVGIAVMAVVTRSIATSLRTAAAITLSQVVLVGLISAVGRPLDMTLSMVPPMMMAMGYSFAAHRALRPGTTGVLALCMGTTSLGIGSFALTDLSPIVGFATFGVIGLVLVWLAVVMLVPSMPARLEAPDRGGVDAWCRFTRLSAGPILTVFVMMSAVAAGLFPLIASDSDPVGYFPADSAIARDFHTLDRRWVGMLPFAVQLNRESPAMPPIAETPGVDRIIGPRPAPGGVNYTGFARLDALDTVAGAARSQWRAWAEDHGVGLEFRGVAAQLDAMTQMVRHVAQAAVPSMLAIAGLAVGWATRSVRVCLISVIANTAPLVGLGLFLEATGWPLTLPSMMVGAIAIGMSVDDTLHLSCEAAERGGIDAGLRRCMRPCVGSSVAVCAGMLMFTLSPFEPTMQFGVLLTVAAASALVGDLVLLPALWRLLIPDASRAGAAAATAPAGSLHVN